MAGMFERFFAGWISAFAAFAFLISVFLALVHIISWMHVVYVYASITGITLALAALCYASKDRD